MKDNNTFFVTTPIYYTNGIPHIGHSYSSIIADTLARYNKISAKRVKFSTGVDENSQKAVEKAQELDIEITDYLDNMAEKHKAVWDGLKLNYTDFIRTTESRHHKLVRQVLQKAYDNGDIYEGEYEGMYCIGCEAFKKDEDLVYLNKTTAETFAISPKVKVSDNICKICPDHNREPQILKEKNYFFRLSKYQKFLEEYYENNPNFVIPHDRFNEVIAFVKRGLDDFSISRETNKFGIKLPFDESQVTYVWYDALFNYVTVCAIPDDRLRPVSIETGLNDMDFWPANLHVVGKDIIRFHAIYWPAMLKSAGYELPKQILTTGFFTVDGQKISKSLGNVIDPVEFSQKYSKDLLVLYLLSSFNIGQDGDFDQNQAIFTYNSKLANNLGNLVNRVLVLALKLSKKSGELFGKLDKEFNYSKIYQFIGEYNLKGALDDSFKILDELNKYTDTNEPWNLIKEDEEKTREVLYTLAEGLRQVGLSLYSFFPEKMGEMFLKLGLENYVEQLEDGKLEELRDKKEIFYIKEKGEVLFKRVDV